MMYTEYFILALNLTGGDFNSQIGLQAWSYEIPIEKRRVAPQSYTLIRAPPPIGLSAFTGRKRKYIQINNSAVLIKSGI